MIYKLPDLNSYKIILKQAIYDNFVTFILQQELCKLPLHVGILRRYFCGRRRQFSYYRLIMPSSPLDAIAFEIQSSTVDSVNNFYI